MRNLDGWIDDGRDDGTGWMERRITGRHRTDGHHGYYYVGDLRLLDFPTQENKMQEPSNFQIFFPFIPVSQCVLKVKRLATTITRGMSHM